MQSPREETREKRGQENAQGTSRGKIASLVPPSRRAWAPRESAVEELKKQPRGKESGLEGDGGGPLLTCKQLYRCPAFFPSFSLRYLHKSTVFKQPSPSVKSARASALVPQNCVWLTHAAALHRKTLAAAPLSTQGETDTMLSPSFPLSPPWRPASIALRSPCCRCGLLLFSPPPLLHPLPAVEGPQRVALAFFTPMCFVSPACFSHPSSLLLEATTC